MWMGWGEGMNVYHIVIDYFGSHLEYISPIISSLQLLHINMIWLWHWIGILFSFSSRTYISCTKQVHSIHYNPTMNIPYLWDISFFKHQGMFYFIGYMYMLAEMLLLYPCLHVKLSDLLIAYHAKAQTDNVLDILEKLNMPTDTLGHCIYLT